MSDQIEAYPEEIRLRQSAVHATRSNDLIVHAPHALVNFGYDAASRLHTVTQGSSVATYTYVANSPLVGQIVLQQTAAPGMTISKQFDYLNRLTAISALNSQQSTFNSFSYNYNSANQRSRVTLADGPYWLLNYDSLGQVTGGTKFWSDGTPVAGQQFGYAFDSIGNRTSITAGGDENGDKQRVSTYAANELNQYTSRYVPNTFDVIGLGLASNTVKVNLQTAYRKGEYFWKEISLDNSTNAWQTVKVSSGTETSVLGSVFVPRCPESYSYDADGNLTQDGRWQYTWDAENRLVQMQALSSVPTGARFKLDFAYDWQGRRMQKIVSTNNGSVAGYLKIGQLK